MRSLMRGLISKFHFLIKRRISSQVIFTQVNNNTEMVFLPGFVFWRWKNRLNYHSSTEAFVMMHVVQNKILRHSQNYRSFVGNKRHLFQNR